MTRYRVELMHKITVLSNWATNEHVDTISSLSEKQAQQIIWKINDIWKVVDRRKP